MSNLNITRKLNNAQGFKGDSKSNCTLQHCSQHSVTLSTFERKMSSEETGTAEMPESCLRCPCIKTHVSNDKMLRENVQQITGEEHQKNETEKRVKLWHTEMCHRSRRKTTNPINLSRKAKSFLRKRSRLATTDSDCTLILPGPRRVKGRQYRYERARDRLKLCQLSRRRNWINGMNSIRMKSNASRRNRLKRSRVLANLRADNPFDQPSPPIPLETQELLNKSYWEYYRKLRCEETHEEDKRSNELRSRTNLPESRTLQQCSVLSCMINNTL